MSLPMTTFNTEAATTAAQAKATRAIFHPRSQCSFQELLRCHRPEKCNPATRCDGMIWWQINCNIMSLQYFGNFSNDVALPAQDMLHVQYFPCDSNAIISWNCITIARKKLHVYPRLKQLSIERPNKTHVWSDFHVFYLLLNKTSDIQMYVSQMIIFYSMAE